MENSRKNTDLEIVAVDLDGTLAEQVWTLDNPTDEIGDPIWKNVEKLRQLRASGWKVIIHTARHWHHYAAIISWLDWWDIKHDGVVCAKIQAAAYIDDRAIHADDEDWHPDD